MALGYTQTKAATEADVPLRTVQDWCSKGLDDLADAYHEIGWARLDPIFWGNIELALDLQRKVFMLELPADEPAYLEARKWIDRALNRGGSTSGNVRRPLDDESKPVELPADQRDKPSGPA